MLTQILRFDSIFNHKLRFDQIFDSISIILDLYGVKYTSHILKKENESQLVLNSYNIQG